MKSLLLSGLLTGVLLGTVSAETQWIEPFEDAFPPTGWIAQSVDQSTTYAFDDSVCSAKLGASGDFLITPLISSASTLIFWSYTTAADPDIWIEHATSTLGPWAAFPEAPFISDTEQWNGRWIDLSGLNNIYVRFRKSGTGTLYLDHVSIDDGISVSNQPPVLDPIPDQNILIDQPFSIPITASDPIDDDPITLHATHLPSGSFFTNGVLVWDKPSPAGVYHIIFTASDKDGSDHHTLSLTVKKRPALLISEIADPSGTGGGDFRFVELYNVGGPSLDLLAHQIHLCKQMNGGRWTDIPLTGLLAGGTPWVVAFDAPSFQAGYGLTPDQTHEAISGNGDDAYFLYMDGDHLTGSLLDLYGALDTDGTDTAWDYENSRAERNNLTLTPNPAWNASEWNITPDASSQAMTPGRHGPPPTFKNLSNLFVFLGGDVNLSVTALNAIRPDLITLSASDLPQGASFQTTTHSNLVQSSLLWDQPPTGNYPISFSATGQSGTTTQTITLTVASRAKIDGLFEGWTPSTIVKLNNGQFWKNSGGVGPSLDIPLRNPGVTVTHHLKIQWRMIVDDTLGYTKIEPCPVIESATVPPFTGLHHENLYALADGTSWKQISFENIPAAESSVTAWRWEENNQMRLRFLDPNHHAIGTCIVEPTAPPPPPPVLCHIDGWFHGFGLRSIFHLTDGSWWRQTSLDSSSSEHWNPELFIRHENGASLLDFPTLGKQITAIQLPVDSESIVTNAFSGLRYGNRYPLRSGDEWIQISFERIHSLCETPTAIRWTENAQTHLLLRGDRNQSIGTVLVQNPHMDTDNDHFSIAEELIVGSDPNHAQSTFKITEPTQDDQGRPVLHWHAIEDRIYTIEWTPSLTTEFLPIATDLVCPQNSWTNTLQTVCPAGFYRITVRLED